MSARFIEVHSATQGEKTLVNVDHIHNVYNVSDEIREINQAIMSPRARSIIVQTGATFEVRETYEEIRSMLRPQ